MVDKTTNPSSLQPIQIAVIGTKDVTGGPAPLTTGTEVVTPGAHQPNGILMVVTPLVAIAIRFGNMYLTVLVGLVAAGMTSDAIPSTDFFHLVKTCAGLSLAGPGLGVLKDCLTIFTRLEGKFPLLTGNV